MLEEKLDADMRDMVKEELSELEATIRRIRSKNESFAYSERS